MNSSSLHTLAFTFKLLICLSAFYIVAGQTNTEKPLLTNNNIHEYTILNENWKVVYTNEDIKSIDVVDFSNSVMCSSNAFFNELPADWHGKIWAYKEFTISKSLVGMPLALNVYQSGDLNLFYRDSVYNFGYTPGGQLISFKILTFDSSYVQRLTVCFNDPDYQTHLEAGVLAGFYIRISDPEYAVKEMTAQQNFDRSFQMFFTAFILAFSILHLVLFIYLPELKGNLYFLFFLVFYALNIYFDYSNFLSRHVDETLLYLRIHRSVLPLVNIFALRFLYALFQPKLPKQFYIIAVLMLVGGALAVYAPITKFYLVNITLLIGLVEIARILTDANKKKLDGARIVTLGFIVLFIFSLYDLLNDIDVVGPIGRLTNAYMFGTMGLVICISIYLAKVFALSNRRLSEEEAQRVHLEADNERKTWELEEARKLQLSLLPQCGTELLGYDVCFQMRTANEVGGDYYDYMITNNDTLTVVVGDATGHGMKAGNMVVLIKSLFNTMGHTFYIPDFFNHCTRQIKRMNFGNLFMSMTIIKLRYNNLVVSTAGMPPTLIFKQATGKVKEILIKSMPLGAHEQFPYREEMESLLPGDVIMLLSDGITELFNKSKKMFGLERVKEILELYHDQSPSQMVDKVFKECDKWRGGRLQDDDITIVVLKRK